MHGRLRVSTAVCLLGLALAGCRTIGPHAAAPAQPESATAHADGADAVRTQPPLARKYLTDVTTAGWENPGMNWNSVGVPASWSNSNCQLGLQGAGGGFV